MAVQPEVKNKSLVSTVLDLADDTFLSFTGGISAGEFRGMLLGDQPGGGYARL